MANNIRIHSHGNKQRHHLQLCWNLIKAETPQVFLGVTVIPVLHGLKSNLESLNHCEKPKNQPIHRQISRFKVIFTLNPFKLTLTF